MRRMIIAITATLLLLTAAPALTQEPGAEGDDDTSMPAGQSLDPFRRSAPLTSEPDAAPMARVENRDLRRKRGWPEQPPTIPHRIDGYQLDRNSNRCMVCHSRAAAEQFQAPMVSITHFMDREGQVLAELSPRRYFCTLCHVVQSDAALLVDNEFIEVDQLIDRTQVP